jgi:hypothetical protein
MTNSDYKPDVFSVSTLEEAMKIILTPEAGTKPAERWEMETPPMTDMLVDCLNPSPEHTVIDYGCGVGRLA